jgi:small subunit ribosomal protein S20
MANHPSAEKRIRRNARRTETNHARISRIRTFVKRVEKAIDTGDKNAAQEAFKAAQPEMQRGVVKGVLHRNTVARKLSRLSARIKLIDASPA